MLERGCKVASFERLTHDDAGKRRAAVSMMLELVDILTSAVWRAWNLSCAVRFRKEAVSRNFTQTTLMVY